jgi:hypothetical protein
VTPPLLVMVPTRWRRENCERLLKSFQGATDNADLVFITDSDDQDTYEGMDWGNAIHSSIDWGDRRVGTTAKVNYIAAAEMANYHALAYIGDDHLFSTPHWDTILLKRLKDMGGTGMVYGDDKRRNDIPEMVIITADIVRELGHFAEPSLVHYYIDNAWAELGGRSNLIRYCPETVFEHLHYQVNKNVDHDQTYYFAENNWGNSDMQAYYAWRENVMPHQAAQLRRRFNKDLVWLFNQV